MTLEGIAASQKPDRFMLQGLTPSQWEALCDRCGRCCLHKLQDEDTGRIVTTMVAYSLLDRDRCRRYAFRHRWVAHCIRLSADNIDAIPLLPVSCAYRHVAEGRPLAWWHLLKSGDPDSVHQAGISVRDFALSEADVHPDDWPTLIIDWSAIGL